LASADTKPSSPKAIPSEQGPRSADVAAGAVGSRHLTTGQKAGVETASFAPGYARPELDVDQAHELLERWLG